MGAEVEKIESRSAKKKILKDFCVGKKL